MIILDRIFIKIFTILENLKEQAYLRICIHKGLKVGENVRFVEVPKFGTEPFLIEIGDDTTFSNNVRFVNHDGGQNAVQLLNKYNDVRTFGRIKIGNKCLIGVDTIIMPGVEMKNNCILGAGSILTTSMPEGVIYAGVPAKYICTIQEYGDKLLANNVIYPRELEKDRSALDKYISENLPKVYKPIKPIKNAKKENPN